MMRFKYFLIVLSIFIIGSKYSYAQKVSDTLTTLTDTINIYGKVINEKGEVLVGANVISRTLDGKNNYRTTKTDSNGHFFLKGINPIDTLIFYYGIEDKIVRNIKSRYLLVKIESQSKQYSVSAELSISAKKKSSNPKLLMKRVAKEPTYTFDRVYNPLPALYPGGMNKLYQYLKNSIVYPKAAIENNIEGIVNIEFTINKEGVATNFLIINDIGYGCSEEAIRALKNMRKWIPAMNEGKYFPQRISLEIPFKLVE
ncbi:TonB family protein [Pedobacter sp. LMG 31464]|uniref:TonB family protein n=1 Tax=Pedobacter planticolens TaxID=2679964 RepID=A0A923DU77_9SPHI|nr:TonB family protein [Pedobacter planticolens]MBB2143931.1 TonB family protein [Pedobacter planticolens]